MIHLLDTGVWLRSIGLAESLPSRIRSILNEKATVFGLSAISLWEVGKKHQIGKLELDSSDLSVWFKDSITENLELLPITPEIVADAMSLPQFPNRDPADELITATARVHDLTLLTTDTALKNYKHARIHYFKPLQAD